jgi:hypothetical protein
MDDSPLPAPPGKPWLPTWLVATGIIAFAIFSVSVAGLTVWLLTREPVRDTVSVPPGHRASIPPAAPLADPSSPSARADSEFKSLFNGQDLADWDYNPAEWSVRDGVIRGRTGNGTSSLFWTGGDVEDFELHFQFRLLRGNSGVYYRARQLEKFNTGGYEFEIYTNRIGNLADNGPDRERRRLFYQDFEKAPPTDTDWHTGTVIAIGGQFIHRLDGNELCRVEDADARAPRSGVLALHIANATTVEFKDIRLKRIGGN